MDGGGTRNARWIIVVLAGALVSSAVVVYALVQITSPGGEGGDMTAVTSSSPTARVTSTAPASSAGTSPGAVSSGPPTTHSAAVSPPSSASFDATHLVPATTSSMLAQSDVMLPAAWSGVAKVTVTVLGECASDSSSVYADLPADVALDLVQNEASAAQVAIPAGVDPNKLTLTVGVNSSGVPSLAVYSSLIDESGQMQRLWDLDVTGDGTRTALHGTLTAQPSDGSTPNMMVDAETSLQPCESLGTVSLPRALDNGTTLDGWVTSDAMSLSVHGVTTDDKRMVTVEITGQRND